MIYPLCWFLFSCTFSFAYACEAHGKVGLQRLVEKQLQQNKLPLQLVSHGVSQYTDPHQIELMYVGDKPLSLAQARYFVIAHEYHLRQRLNEKHSVECLLHKAFSLGDIDFCIAFKSQGAVRYYQKPYLALVVLHKEKGKVELTYLQCEGENLVVCAQESYESALAALRAEGRIDFRFDTEKEGCELPYP
jgi:hypothetical protein